MRRRMWAATAALTITCSLALPAAAHADGVGCAPATVVGIVEPEVPLVNWAENLTYDSAGYLWVTRTLEGVIDRYDPAGRHVGSVALPSPGSIRQGPDGLMYAVSGAQPLNLVSPILTGYVVRIDPNDVGLRPHLFADGFGMPNGLAVDADGSVYVADSKLGVVRLGPDGRRDEAWTQAAPHPFDFARGVDGYGTNGVVIHDGSLYVTVSESLSATVLRIPVDAPAASSVIAHIGTGDPGIPLIPDDLTVGNDGKLYVAATLGRLVRVDPTTGQTCTVFQGEPMTAVTTVPGSDNLQVATERGGIFTLRLS